MKKSLKTRSASSACLTLAADIAESDHNKASSPLRISVFIAIFSPGEATVASLQSFLALVKISTLPSTPLAVVLRDQSLLELLPGPGDVCLLPPGTSVTNPDSSQDELLQFRFPRQSILSFAQRRPVPAIDTLSAPCVAADPIMTALARMAGALLHDRKKQSDCSTAHYLTLSLYSHLLNRYGVAGGYKKNFTGGLAPKHKLIAQQALRSAPDNAITTEKVAEACGLSPAHFARAFRQTFGISFQRQILDSRIRKAKQLLQRSDASLKSIAIQVGYADQATFTESFSRAVGMAPGRYRRRFAIDQPRTFTDDLKI